MHWVTNADKQVEEYTIIIRAVKKPSNLVMMSPDLKKPEAIWQFPI